MVNTLDICEGLITRKRVLESKTEEAVLDFYIVNEKMRPYLKKMIIDEQRSFCLSNFAQYRRNKRVIETDHNGEILELDLQFEKRKPERVEMFNLKNKRCQDNFYEETDDNSELLEILKTDLPFDIQSKKWLKTFNSILYKCFRKVRIGNNKKKENSGTQNLMMDRIKLKNDIKSNTIDEEMKEMILQRISDIEKEIGDEVAEENAKEITEIIRSLGVDDVSLGPDGRKKMWRILKRKYPKNVTAVPVGKKDQKGNLITNHEGLKKLYLKTYIHRLRNRPIRGDFEELKKMKNELFKLRLSLSACNKSRPWEMKELEQVLNSLKKDKARDPNGWINEIFKEGVAGRDLKKSMLDFFNKMKSENYIPDFMRLADVVTIYKGKGEKSSLENDRGIFMVTTFRSILMHLIYEDKYEQIDQSMSDSQVGGRKGKNIRNHIWIVNGIISDVLSTKKKSPVDIQIFDYKQCFDSLWLEECLNDLYSAGVKDDNFQLLYNVNSKVNVSVKTPVGKTARDKISNSVTQGDVFGPIFCSKQVDTIGQECLDQHKYTYMYKGEVEIPPLGMVDDLLCVSECGVKTSMLNSYINFKTNTKKLQFGVSKCKKIHVGKICEEHKCQNLLVDSWAEVEDESLEMQDQFVGEELMEESQGEKYLGDIVSNDGRNMKNIQSRVNKGKGIVSRIMTLLEGIPFGQYYFEVAVILRNSLLVSSLLTNSEAWYNVSKAELDYLETVDELLLRSILKAPKTTPKEMLYLELGCFPLRNLIQKRRISFLYYLLHQDPESMLYKFLQSQLRNRNIKDWTSTVLQDLKELKWDMNMDEIKNMKKSEFKRMLKEKTEEKSINDLNVVKSGHSKVKHLKHSMMQMRNYFKQTSMKQTKEEIQLIFKLRARMTDIKMNYKGIYDSFECSACKEEEESQTHMFECKEILKKYEEDYKEEYKVEYEKIFDGKVKDQVEIARIFKKLMKIKDKINKET